MTDFMPGVPAAGHVAANAPDRDELVKGIRMAITSWNVLGPRKVGEEDVSEFIADWLITNRVISPDRPKEV